jgi:uncharacterized protein YjbJ (UPF0337 family)
LPIGSSQIAENQGTPEKAARSSHKHRTMESIMGELVDKVKGIANEVAGNAKQIEGERKNDSDKKAEGLGQELKGKAQQIKGSIKGALDDKI